MFKHHSLYKIKYSQNFLRSFATAKSLVDSMQLEPTDRVIEIGPGSGQLTKHFVNKVAVVIAIDKDPNLSAKLAGRLGEPKNLVSLHGDFAELELPVNGYKIVGNIPFAQTAEIVRKLTSYRAPPLASFLIMQFEAAQKLTGKPHETLQSLSLKARFDIEILKFLPAKEFVPQPKVNAALVAIKLNEKLSGNALKNYLSLLNEAFNGNYQSLFEFLEKKYGYRRAVEINRQINARKLRRAIRFEEWVKLAEVLV